MAASIHSTAAAAGAGSVSAPNPSRAWAGRGLRGAPALDAEAPTGLQQIAWCSALAWLYLYMSDIRILWDRPLHLLVAPILVGAALPCFAGLSRRVLMLGGVLLLLWVYQGAVSREFQWRNLVELGLGVYFFSLTPFRTGWGTRWLGAGLGAYFAASFFLFLATVFLPDIRDWRAWLYLRSEKTLASLENVALTEEAMTVQQGGFTPYLHLFGYQISAGIGLLVALATLQRGVRAWAWYGPVALGVVTLFLAGQRSAFLGLAIAGLAVIVLLRRFWMAAGLIAVLGVLMFVVAETSTGVSDLREYNVVERMQSSDSDFGSRLELQWWAFCQVFSHPFGLIGAGIDYFEVAPDLLGTRVVAPHNGYITRLLLFGWPVGLLTVVMFGLIFRMGRATWRRYDGTPGAALEVTALLGLLGAMANALFHNASFATFNAETLTLLFLYAVGFSLREHGSADARLAAATADGVAPAAKVTEASTDTDDEDDEDDDEGAEAGDGNAVVAAGSDDDDADGDEDDEDADDAPAAGRRLGRPRSPMARGAASVKDPLSESKPSSRSIAPPQTPGSNLQP